MAQIKCTECGQIFDDSLNECPNCACPIASHDEAVEDDGAYKTVSELFWSCQFYKVFRGKHSDLGQRIYEVGSLWWECIIHALAYSFLPRGGDGYAPLVER